jgi:hypothetical protein
MQEIVKTHYEDWIWVMINILRIAQVSGACLPPGSTGLQFIIRSRSNWRNSRLGDTVTAAFVPEILLEVQARVMDDSCSLTVTDNQGLINYATLDNEVGGLNNEQI